MNKHLHIVIMAGGSGTRFWPYSRNKKPKQFLDVLGTGRSLLQMTYDRFKGTASEANIWIVSNEIYDDLLHEQFPEMDDSKILLEPSKRNTAPCIAYAAYKIRQKDPDAIMVVLPSDHVIFNEKEFISTIEKAVAFTDDQKLITIGIQPIRPETGYGYIQYLDETNQDLKKVKTFTEKPDSELAQKFIESGDFVWNAGIFVWKVNAIISAIEELQPELAECFNSNQYFTDQEKKYIETSYAHCQNISIDYAIMEKSPHVYTILGNFGWSDLGSWNALHEIMDKDENLNVAQGKVTLYESSDNFIISKSKNKDKLMVLQGLEGYLVADFEDILLICKKEDSSIFREFVSDIKLQKGEEFI
ncbi:MAG: mannose-1-phosphate guanylyltransferase [Bacteroidota bacterium]